MIKAELCRLNAAVAFSVHTINCITDIAVLQESAEILQTGISSQILLIQTILDLLLKSRPGFSVFWEKKTWCSQLHGLSFFNQITALRSGPVRSEMLCTLLKPSIFRECDPKCQRSTHSSSGYRGQPVRSLCWNINARRFLFFFFFFFSHFNFWKSFWWIRTFNPFQRQWAFPPH